MIVMLRSWRFEHFGCFENLISHFCGCSAFGVKGLIGGPIGGIKGVGLWQICESFVMF